LYLTIKMILMVKYCKQQN